MSKLAILGASGHGKVIAEIAELNGYSEVFFFDDRWPALGKVEHWDVVGDSESLLANCVEYDGVFVAIGHNSTRIAKQTLLATQGACFPILKHPSATVSNYSQIGDGTVVMAGAIINPFSTIGASCIINTSATIDHDSLLDDAVHISPGANIAGGVSVGCRSWIGIGASVKQLVKIGSDVMVGAGSAVIHDVTDEQVVVGVPAQLLKNKD